MEILAEIKRIVIDEFAGSQFVFVGEKDGVYGRCFPMVIGIYDAYAIYRAVTKVAMPRPMTHPLINKVISELGGVLEKVVITDIRDNTFIGKLVIASVDGGNGETGNILEVDCRPSDGLVLAILRGAGIFVESEVFDTLKKCGGM